MRRGRGGTGKTRRGMKRDVSARRRRGMEMTRSTDVTSVMATASDVIIVKNAAMTQTRNITSAMMKTKKHDACATRNAGRGRNEKSRSKFT